MGRIYQLILLLLLSIRLDSALAQSDRFAPPPPPPLEDEEDDFDEDFIEDEEAGDETGIDHSVRPPPPMPNGLPPGVPPTMPNFSRGQDFRGNIGGSNFGGNGSAAVRFKIVEGEFWQKGQRRSRGRKNAH